MTLQVGGYGAGQARVNIIQQMNHDGEVNRARAMPQNPFMIATKPPTHDVLVYDYSKHPSKPLSDGVSRPDLTLKGHRGEGYGLAWSPYHAGYLLSGSDDAQVCLWDLNANTTNQKILHAKSIYSEHQNIVEDVAWHCHAPDIFGSVSDDKQVHLSQPSSAYAPLTCVSLRS
jgi:histone-binding protein RBBP4